MINTKEINKEILKASKVEDRIKALARAMSINNVNVCGFGALGALEMASKVLKTLNREGYDIKPKENK